MSNLTSSLSSHDDTANIPFAVRFRYPSLEAFFVELQKTDLEARTSGELALDNGDRTEFLRDLGQFMNDVAGVMGVVHWDALVKAVAPPTPSVNMDFMDRIENDPQPVEDDENLA